MRATIFGRDRIPSVSRDHPLSLRVSGKLRASGRERIEYRRAEESGLLLRGRHLAHARDALLVAQPLVVGKPEGSIAKDWTANGAAKLVALALRLRRSEQLREIVVGIERVVAEKFVRRCPARCSCLT